MKNAYIYATLLVLLALTISMIPVASATYCRYEGYYNSDQNEKWISRGWFVDNDFYSELHIPRWTYLPMVNAWVTSPYIQLYSSDTQVQGYVADSPYVQDLLIHTSHLNFVWSSQGYQERIYALYGINSCGYPDHGQDMWCETIDIPTHNGQKPDLVAFQVYFELFPGITGWIEYTEGCGLGMKIYSN